jgi:hypothetical protein
MSEEKFEADVKKSIAVAIASVDRTMLRGIALTQIWMRSAGPNFKSFSV